MWQTKLTGSYAQWTAVIFFLISLLLAGDALTANSPLPTRLLPFFLSGAVASLALYARHRYSSTRFTGLYLVCVYLSMAFGLVASTGIGTGTGIVILTAWAIVLTGLLGGYRSALVPATISTIFFTAFRAAELRGMVHPAYITTKAPTDFKMVIILAVLCQVVAALGGYLHYTNQLRRKLKAAEAQNTWQLHRLTEAGAMSTVLIHDLANSLTSLTLEIDSIENTKDKESIRRAKEQLNQINDMLRRTRRRLKGEYRPEVFNLTREVGHTIKYLRTTAQRAGVELVWTKPTHPRTSLQNTSSGIPSRAFNCAGDKTLFRQLLTNIINNAIESYEPAEPIRAQRRHSKRKVLVTLTAQDDNNVLTITDWGVGMTPQSASNVFKPFYTTKKNGIGIGMYLTRRFIESSFSGSIDLKSIKSSNKQTILTITLPQAL